MRASLLAALLALLAAGCFTPREGSESTAPTPTPTVPSGPLGTSSEGCTGNHTVGTGNGQIGSDHACNLTQPNASV
ncbi:MAG: hypothetical protein QOE90_2943 [Thermoplasmata archaeon]|jgi:hypothetical protein|nr:hypothetical protein [Thermoplasmata archaeon]